MSDELTDASPTAIRRRLRTREVQLAAARARVATLEGENAALRRELDELRAFRREAAELRLRIRTYRREVGAPGVAGIRQAPPLTARAAGPAATVDEGKKLSQAHKRLEFD